MSKSKYPEQTNPTTKERRAIAPYNFIQIPEQVIAAEDARVKHDTYHAGRHTGQITATLRAVSPLYTRTGLTPEDFAAISGKSFSELSDKKQRYAEFFQLYGEPTIPGSSLRGMLRTLIEIVTQSKLARVTNSERYFYRAVAAKSDDPLAAPYKAAFNHRNVQAGYLVQKGLQWFIQPAQEVDGATFLWVKEHYLTSKSLIKLTDENYHPQCLDVTFQSTQVNNNGKRFARDVVENGRGQYAGKLVTSGNMAETGQAHRTRRKNHCVVTAPDASKDAIPLSETAIQDYRSSLTNFQKESFFGDNGMLQNGQPVFYLPAPEGQPIVFFGHSPYFRVPYRFKGSQRAASPLDFVPQELRDPTITDIAEAMFGYVPDDKRNDTRQAYAGRVFVDDAVLVEEQRGPDSDVWLNLNGQAYLVPQILGSPKPTTFQHYLVQPTISDEEKQRVRDEEEKRAKRDKKKPRNLTDEEIERLLLKHYASTPVKETVIRGHKLYWHKGMVPANHIKHPDVTPGKEGTQHTSMRPVKPDTRFALSIRFENLSDVELGVLLWLLQLASDGQHALKLGMGKPLGLGSVQLEGLTVYVANRRARYTTLFDETGNWETGAAVWDADRQRQCVDAFQQYIADHSGVTGKPSFEQLPRTQQLRCMLAWPGPAPKETKYMQLPVFKDRPILPRPDALCSGGQDNARTASHAQSSVEQNNLSNTSTQQSEPALPQPGTKFTGKIREVDEQRVLIHVPDFSNAWAVIEQEHRGQRQYKVGEMARVEVIGIEERKGRTILKVKPAPKN